MGALTDEGRSNRTGCTAQDGPLRNGVMADMGRMTLTAAPGVRGTFVAESTHPAAITMLPSPEQQERIRRASSCA
jgi:hypothetical protein